MTNEEAIEYLSDDDNYIYDNEGNLAIKFNNEAVEMAIEALKYAEFMNVRLPSETAGTRKTGKGLS